MKAVLIHEFGGPEMLRYENVPDPSPGPGEVLIEVHAAGVNFADYLMCIGAYAAGQLPIIPGLEAAGVVKALGSGVIGFELGQQVIAWTQHTYAELATAPVETVLPAPPGLSLKEAAAIPVAFGTAWHALVTLAKVGQGERVLVHAAGSGVGSAAIQLAKQLGTWVVTTAGHGWKLERARALGADALINYTTQNVAEEVMRLTDGQGVGIALEGVGKTTFSASIASLAEGGRLVVYGAPSGPRVELDTRPTIFRNITLYGMLITHRGRFRETLGDFAREAPIWFEQGRLRPVVDTIYPLAEAAEAHQRLMSRSQFGKLVLRMLE